MNFLLQEEGAARNIRDNSWNIGVQVEIVGN